MQADAGQPGVLSIVAIVVSLDEVRARLCVDIRAASKFKLENYHF